MSTLRSTAEQDYSPPSHLASEHHHPGFVQRYIFSTDHKVIGLQFLFTSLALLLVGGALALLIRWQLAWPWSDIPIIGKALFASTGGQMSPEFYTMLFTMHGTVMVFLVIIPILTGAFGNFLIPLQIGAPDMAFPRVNMFSYWILWPGIIAFGMAFASGGDFGAGAGSGWTSYPVLAAIKDAAPGSGNAQTWWLIGLTFVGISSITGSVNYMTTILNMRAPGMTLFRMPMTIWGLFITSILQAFALPVLTAAGIMLIADREFGTSFFIPAGQLIGENAPTVGHGQPLLWQHLFWFYSHPAVYVMVLPAMGMTSDMLATMCRKPLFGYKPMIYSMVTIAGLGFVVWGHHMFTSGMNPALGMTFMVSTIMISLPSGIKTFNWLATIWGGRVRFNTTMLCCAAFISMFIIGGLSGIFMAAVPVDVHMHDTAIIVAHFHYIVFGATLFCVFGAVHYWFPKMFGRMMSERLGKVHFLLTFLAFNGTFFPMHMVGLRGMPRRYADPYIHPFLEHLMPINQFMTICAFIMGFAQLIFLANLIGSIFWGRKVGPNPWDANGLEWVAPSPPPHGNFLEIPHVYHGPYEYSSPLAGDRDFIPQTDIPATHA